MTNFTITHFTLKPFQVPLIRPLRQSNGTIDELMVLALTLHTKDGVTGQSFIYGIGKFGHTALIPYIENELIPSIIGREFTSPAEAWNSTWLPRRDKLKGGLCLYGLALIDIACWDIAAKSEQKSLHHLLGGECEAVPVYGSGGWLSMSLDELYDECHGFIEKGILTYKIKVGGKNDEERISFLRREFGNKINIAADANQLLELEQSVKLGKILQNYNISWFEDPLYSDSIFELKKLFQTMDVPLCIGENYSAESQFEDVCNLNIAEFLQGDIIRCGGITPFLKIISVAEKYNKKFITHLTPELSISLLGLCKTAYACEFIDLFSSELFTQEFTIINGLLQIPTAPGIGVYIKHS